MLQHGCKFRVADWWWTIWFDVLFTFTQLLNLNPCCKIRATKCLQRTIALYQYKLFILFPFCLKTLDNMCDRNQGLFLFLATWATSLWLRLCTLQCEWMNILLRTPSIWFLLDRNALRFSLHMAESVVREIQKTKRSVIVLFFNLLLVASLRSQFS